jgi:hypothetical protein
LTDPTGHQSCVQGEGTCISSNTAPTSSFSEGLTIWVDLRPLCSSCTLLEGELAFDETLPLDIDEGAPPTLDDLTLGDLADMGVYPRNGAPVTIGDPSSGLPVTTPSITYDPYLEIGLGFLPVLERILFGQGFMEGTTNIVSAARGTASVRAAAYAQTSYSERFSAEGVKLYSRLARQPIRTIDDLAQSLRAGAIRPQDVPVNYVVRNGRALIHNTRTATALERAGIPRSQWSFVDQTNNLKFRLLLRKQLMRNGLLSSPWRGSATGVTAPLPK